MHRKYTKNKIIIIESIEVLKTIVKTLFVLKKVSNSKFFKVNLKINSTEDSKIILNQNFIYVEKNKSKFLKIYSKII